MHQILQPNCLHSPPCLGPIHPACEPSHFAPHTPHPSTHGSCLQAFSPCELFARIRGRTLWFAGDSHTWGMFTAAECFLREFALSPARRQAPLLQAAHARLWQAPPLQAAHARLRADQPAGATYQPPARHLMLHSSCWPAGRLWPTLPTAWRCGFCPTSARQPAWSWRRALECVGCEWTPRRRCRPRQAGGRAGRPPVLPRPLLLRRMPGLQGTQPWVKQRLAVLVPCPARPLLQVLPRLMQLVENFTSDILVMNFG